MPGDLRNPETSAFPTYYDNKYDKAPNQFDPGAFDIDGYLQSIVFESLGRKLKNEKLKELKNEALGKGLFHLNFGDQDFRQGIINLIKINKMARRISKKCKIQIG